MKLLHFASDFIGRPPRPMLRGKVYYIRQRIGGKDVWRSLHTRDKREAEYLAVEIWRMRQTDRVKAIIPAPPRKLPLIWETYAATDRYMELAESTRSTKARIWSAFVAWCNDHRIEYPEQLTKELATSYLASGGRKNKTYNNVLNDLCQAFQYGGAVPNVFDSIERLSTHRGKADKRSDQFRAFTDDEINRIFEAISKSKMENSKEWLIAAKIASMTGLRYKDIALLRWDAVKSDELGKFIELSPAKTENKTGGKLVYIRLVPELARLLTIRQATVSGDYILPALAHSYHDRWNAATRPFLQLCRRIGINGSFHCFRVTVVTKAAKAGIDLEEFGGVIGHTTENQTKAYNRAALNIDMERVLSVKLG